MIFGTFVMFSILSHVVLTFSKTAILGRFNVIQEEIMQIGKTKLLKTCEDFGKTMNENSRDLRRHYKGRNFVLKSQDVLHGSKYSKRQRNKKFRTGSSTYALREWAMRPGHCKICLCSQPCAWGMLGEGQKPLFHLLSKRILWNLSQNKLEFFNKTWIKYEFLCFWC